MNNQPLRRLDGDLFRYGWFEFYGGPSRSSMHGDSRSPFKRPKKEAPETGSLNGATSADLWRGPDAKGDYLVFSFFASKILAIVVRDAGTSGGRGSNRVALTSY